MPELATVKDNFRQITEQLKVPPHSIEAEQAVLGGLMLDNTAWDKVADIIGEQDFYRQDHRQIFYSISELSSRNHPIDVVTVSEWLENKNELDGAGGLSYLQHPSNRPICLIECETSVWTW